MVIGVWYLPLFISAFAEPLHAFSTPQCNRIAGRNRAFKKKYCKQMIAQMPVNWSSTLVVVTLLLALTVAIAGRAIASQQRGGGGGAVRLGIVAITTRPDDLRHWLVHHRDHVGVERVYLRVEATPELRRLLRSAEWAHLVRATYVDWAHRSYVDIQTRQRAHVDAAIVRARADGLTHLLHVDDDELLHCPRGAAALREYIARATAIDSLTVQNYEAVYSREAAHDCAHPFATQHFNTSRATFSAYANGKAIGRLSPALRCGGAHGFVGRRGVVPTSLAIVLHYESHCIPRWRAKFAAYARNSSDACASRRIPFMFYCESMTALAPGTDNDNESVDKIWYRWKSHDSGDVDHGRRIVHIPSVGYGEKKSWTQQKA